MRPTATSQAAVAQDVRSLSKWQSTWTTLAQMDWVWTKWCRLFNCLAANLELFLDKDLQFGGAAVVEAFAAPEDVAGVVEEDEGGEGIDAELGFDGAGAFEGAVLGGGEAAAHEDAVVEAQTLAGAGYLDAGVAAFAVRILFGD